MKATPKPLAAFPEKGKVRNIATGVVSVILKTSNKGLNAWMCPADDPFGEQYMAKQPRNYEAVEE